MEEFKDLIAMIVTMLIITLIAILTLAVTPSYLIGRATCSAKAEAQGYEYEFGMFKGCMVKTEKGWMDYNKLIYKKDVE